MGKAELKIEIDAVLLAQARDAGLDIEAVTVAAMRAAVASRADDSKALHWAQENAEAIKAHRERIEEYGVFGEDLRTW